MRQRGTVFFYEYILYVIYFCTFAPIYHQTIMHIRLREILHERGLTLLAFAKISGISQPNLSNYINGNTSPTLDMLQRIADSLNIHVCDLLQEPEEIEILVRYKGDTYRLYDTDIINIINHKQKNG